VDFAAARPEVGSGRIMVVGTRAGAGAAVGLASLPRVCAVVGDGVTGRVLGDRVRVATRSGLLGLVRVPTETSRFVLTELLTGASAPRSYRAGATREGAAPVLLIAAAREPDEQRLADSVHDAAPDRVAVWTVPGTGSGGAVDARRSEWTTRVGDFLASARC
jgi:hypothetical protein